MSAEKISISELSRVSGIDRATIAKRLSKLPFSRGAQNAKFYDRKSAMAIVVVDDQGTADELSAKARRELAEAERSELRVRQIKGELVSADSMRTAAAELIKTLYQRIVRVEPGVIASKCVGKDVVEIETIARESLATVFNELKNMPENFLAIDDDEIIPEVDTEDVDEDGE